VLLFDRLRDPFFEPRHAGFAFVEPRVDLVASPQHAHLEARDVVANVEDLAFDGLEAKVELSCHCIKALSHRLMERREPGENIFACFRAAAGTPHKAIVHYAKACSA
jgi:hypothetical protein